MNFSFKVFAPIVVICLSLSMAYAQSETPKSEWTILPGKHVIPLFTADTRAHRLSLHKPFNDPGYIGSMGGIFPVVRLNKWGKTFQFSAASTLYTTLESYSNRGYLVNVDFFVDFFLDVKLNQSWALRGGLGHTSQHLADDAISAGLKAINFTRDYGQAFVVYTFPKQKAFIYTGGILNTHFKTDIDFGTELMFQIGFEHWPVKWLDNNYLYYAGDIKFRGEQNFGTTQNIQVGYKYMRPLDHTFRFCLNYTTGYEERGQFYDQKRNFATLGIYFDF